MAALAGMLIEFQFYTATVAFGKNDAQFFATVYVVLNALALLVQLFVAPRLQERWGLARVLMVLPGILLGGVGLLSFGASLPARTFLKITESGLKSSIHRSSWEQLYLPIDRASRPVVKSMIDGLTARVAEGIGAAVLYVWVFRQGAIPVRDLDLSWVSWAIAAVLAMWLALTQRLKRLGTKSSEAPEVAITLPECCPVTSVMGRGKRR